MKTMTRRKKIRLIFKFAKIRLHRFWKEWGVSKCEAFMLLEALNLIAFILMLYLIIAVAKML